MATAAYTEADLAVAIRSAMAAHPDGQAAGPKALLADVQAADARFGDVNKHKMKKVLDKVKVAWKEDEEAAKREAALPKVGTKENCPGRHGLRRALTTHASFCCDTCRCYQDRGVWMWGCRLCDWDVCEGRCHPAPVNLVTIENFRQALDSIDEGIGALKAEAPHDLKTKLALKESEVYKVEKKLDNATAKELAENSPLEMSEEDARAQKKDLLQSSEALLSKIEDIFRELAENAS